MRWVDILETGYPLGTLGPACLQESYCCTICVTVPGEDSEAGSEGEQDLPLTNVSKIEQRDTIKPTSPEKNEEKILEFTSIRKASAIDTFGVQAIIIGA